MGTESPRFSSGQQVKEKRKEEKREEETSGKEIQK
jgi:hypothetical protein